MKHYMLFTTNGAGNTKSIDNVSLCIETELSNEEARKLILGACKYNTVTLSPIGEPINGSVELKEALKIIKKIRLHKKERTIVEKHIDIVMSKTDIPGLSVSKEDGHVVLAMFTAYESENPALLVKEHEMIDRLIKKFGCKHVAYHKYRNVFSLVPSDTKELGIDWDIVKDDIVQITKRYDYINVEI